MASRPALSHSNYTVGWICALPTELTAAMAIFDDIHPPLPQHPKDNNSYTLGRIGVHNVVVACLPSGQLGITSAATVASQLRYSFSAIRFWLMVGIGGGAPSKDHDIRLGDVVVSIPGKHSNGVIQYDFGRTVAEGRFICQSQLNAPPPVLLSAVSTVRARHNISSDRLREILLTVNTPQIMSEYTYQGSENDLLFEADYDHVGEDICDDCDLNKIVYRPQRATSSPEIHYGTIASGSQVMRHGRTREHCRRDLDVLCFEMEAAGLMNHFPCLVIRGICDYADSHKNKRWQNYAAVTAAAYAKEILHVVPREQVEENENSWRLNHLAVPEQRKISSSAEIEDSWVPVSADVLSPNDLSRFLVLSRRPDWAVTQEGGLPYNVFERLSNYDPDRTFKSLLRNRCPRTTEWMLVDVKFVSWLQGLSHPCLWLFGKIGCGKTLVTSTVLDHLIRVSRGTGHFIAHFFYTRSNKARLGAHHLFESFVKQMIGHLSTTGTEYPIHVTHRVKHFYGPNGHYANIEEVVDEIFMPLSRLVSKATYVIDGLDECEIDEVRKVLATLRKILTNNDDTRVFISGREQLDITNAIPGSTSILVSEDDTRQDISTFIEWRMEQKMRERRLTEKGSIIRDIKQQLNERADRMILWVSLQLDAIWEDCFTENDIKYALANLPKDLSETYSRCLSRINRRQSHFARKVLSWVCVAINPFTIKQLVEALALDLFSGRIKYDRMPSSEDVLRCCYGLVVRDSDDQVLLAHHSVRQFLEDRENHHPGAEVFPAGIDLDAAELDLATLCISHLSSSDYARPLYYEIPQKPLDFSQVTRAVIDSLGVGFPFYKRPVGPSSKPAYVKIPPKTRPAAPRAPPSFFSFAREQWAPLTHAISKQSGCWEKFKTLALEPNLTWSLHPWEPLGMSLDSHFAGLLGWAIVNHHLPLLDLLFDRLNPSPRADIFDLPIAQYGNLLPLHLATRLGHIDMVQRLLQVCEPAKRDIEGKSALHHAAEIGSEEAVDLLLTKVHDGLQDAKGQYPLQSAAGNGHLQIVTKLVHRSVHINSKDVLGRTALIVAAMNGHESTVDYLVSAGASVKEKDNMDQTALFLALENGHVETAVTLLNFGADPSTLLLSLAVRLAREKIIACMDKRAKNEDGDEITRRVRATLDVCLSNLLNEDDDFDVTVEQQVLCALVLRRFDTIAQLLLKLGAGIEFEDSEGWTLLHWAANNGQELTTQALLARKNVDINRRDHSDWTPLMRAVFCGNETIVRLLLHTQPGIDVGARNRDRQTALIIAAAGNHVDIMRLLLACPYCHINWRDKKGRTALHHAAISGNVEGVRCLILSDEINVNSRDHDSMTPLQHATSNRHRTIAHFLLARNDVDVRSEDEFGRTLLHAAAIAGDAQAVQLLLRKSSVYINSRDHSGWTPLHVAAHYGYEDIVRLLLEYENVDVNMKDLSGDTPRDKAVQKRHKEIAMLLKITRGEDDRSEMWEGMWRCRASSEIMPGYPRLENKMESTLEQMSKHTSTSWPFSAARYSIPMTTEQAKRSLPGDTIPSRSSG